MVSAGAAASGGRRSHPAVVVGGSGGDRTRPPSARRVHRAGRAACVGRGAARDAPHAHSAQPGTDRHGPAGSERSPAHPVPRDRHQGVRIGASAYWGCGSVENGRGARRQCRVGEYGTPAGEHARFLRDASVGTLGAGVFAVAAPVSSARLAGAPHPGAIARHRPSVAAEE
eukprot:ctg_504.g303